MCSDYGVLAPGNQAFVLKSIASMHCGLHSAGSTTLLRHPPPLPTPLTNQPLKAKIRETCGPFPSRTTRKGRQNCRTISSTLRALVMGSISTRGAEGSGAGGVTTGLAAVEFNASALWGKVCIGFFILRETSGCRPFEVWHVGIESTFDLQKQTMACRKNA